jgi:hypothetical protein
MKWKFRTLLAGGLVVFLAMALLSINRMAIAKRQFQYVTLDLRQFNPEQFNLEFSNSRTFRATLVYMDEYKVPQPGIKAWADFLENRTLPKSEFPEQARPKPWILSITKAWIPPGWAWNPNPAVTQMEEFFLTFGWLGLAIGMVFFGIWIRILDLPSNSLFVSTFKAVTIALLFQWISRGFFLFQLQITLVCFLPFFVLFLMASYLPNGSATDKA